MEDVVGDPGAHSSSDKGCSPYTGGPQGRKWLACDTKRSMTRQLSGGAFPCMPAHALTCPRMRTPWRHMRSHAHTCFIVFACGHLSPICRKGSVNY